MNNTNQNNFSLPRFENLNGLRAIGALSVFVFHAFLLGNEIWGDFSDQSWFHGIYKIAGKGNYGVNLFFVLSGFLITYLLLHEAKTNSQINVSGFFMRRLLRIWPVYFLVIFFGFAIFPHLPYGIQTSNSPLYYSLFLSNFEEIWNGWRDPVNFLTVTWSVSIEEQFYMAWVAFMLLLPPVRRGKFFLGYFTVLMIVNIAFRFMYLDAERELYYGTFSVVSDLALGGYLSYLCFYFNFAEKIRSLSKAKIIVIYLVGTALILAGRTIFYKDLQLIERLVIGVFFAFVIAEQAFSNNSFYKADKLPGFFKMGEISYGIYMYHCIVIYYMQVLFVEMNWVDSAVLFFLYLLLSLIATLLLSQLSYQLMEKPLLRLKKYFR